MDLSEQNILIVLIILIILIIIYVVKVDNKQLDKIDKKENITSRPMVAACMIM